MAPQVRLGEVTSQWGQGPPAAETAEGQEDIAVTKPACPGSADGRPSLRGGAGHEWWGASSFSPSRLY